MVVDSPSGAKAPAAARAPDSLPVAREEKTDAGTGWLVSRNLGHGKIFPPIFVFIPRVIL